MNSDDINYDLLTEALLDLTIIIKRNNELINENTKLKKKMEETENDIRKLKGKKSNNH